MVQEAGPGARHQAQAAALPGWASSLQQEGQENQQEGGGRVRGRGGTGLAPGLLAVRWRTRVLSGLVLHLLRTRSESVQGVLRMQEVI